MASFDTDLARYLADYDRAERLSEIEREMTEGVDDWHLNGEDAILIPEPGSFGTPAIWDDREVLGEES